VNGHNWYGSPQGAVDVVPGAFLIPMGPPQGLWRGSEGVGWPLFRVHDTGIC
jgi:hypothetical protein